MEEENWDDDDYVPIPKQAVPTQSNNTYPQASHGRGYRGGQSENNREPRSYGRQENRENGYRGRSDGGNQNNRDEGYRGRRDGGTQNNREDGYRGRRDGGDQNNREDGYRGRRDGGNQNNRQDGYRGRGHGGYQDYSVDGYTGRRDRGYQDNHESGNRGRRDGENQGSNWRERGEWEEGNQSRHGNGFRGQRSDGNSNRSDQNNPDVTFVVPSSKVGMIIGKGGSKITSLQNESGASIKIQKSSTSETEVMLFGSTDQTNKAQELINELIDDSQPPKPQHVERQAPKSRDDNDDERIDTSQYMIVNEYGDRVMDWARFNAMCDEKQRQRLAKLPPLIKDFYNEDPAVSTMSDVDVAEWRKANFDIQVKRTFDDKPGLRPIPNPTITFEQAFKDHPEILEVIYKQGFSKPTPIQAQAWPILLRGEDMIGIAQTGTGKTLAFILPALVHIKGQVIPKEERVGPCVLVIAPTRELALQIQKEVSKYLFGGLKSVCLYGGADRKEQINHLNHGVDIVIATPGRLNDLIKARHLHIINFSYIVLDEADRMLDMGFEPQIKVSLLDVRPDRQTVMTSATWPSGVRRLAETYLTNPIQVNVGSLDLAAVHTVTHHIIMVKEDEKDEMLMQMISELGPTDRVIVFCGKKATASDISSTLAVRGIDCQSFHGDQHQEDRETALEEIDNGTVNILIATDLASRGLDIKDLTHVINLDFPRNIEEYVHRVGRTGRAGRTGTAITFFSRKDWANAAGLIKILDEAYQEVPDELREMAQRFESRPRDTGGRGGRGRGGGRGGGRRDYY